MLTVFKQIFTWWNQQTFGTRLQIFFSGKLVGEDKNGNKYYESKSGRRWIIYKGEVEASKIPNEWYSWMHYMNNKIENNHNLKKYDWQKEHLPNQTGSINSYHPKKYYNGAKKNIKAGKIKILLIIFFSIFSINSLFADTTVKSETIAELSILDKVSSKNTNIKIEVGVEFAFQNLNIKVLKCYNSKFDDDPEVTAYMQVKDKTMFNNDKVYIFNDWTFASSPSIRPFDHPVYDVWLKKCYS